MPSGGERATSARSTPSAVRQRRPAPGIVVGEVERRSRSPSMRSVQPSLRRVEARRLAPSRQAPEQWLGPEVLVDVDSCERG